MIRKYDEAEIPELIEIWEAAAVLAHPFLSDDFNAQVKTAMRDMYLPDSDTWVFEESGKVLGFISMLKNEIGGLFVHPDHHSKGIGRALIIHVQHSHTTLEVEVFDKNKIGKPFYEKYGFEVLKEYTHEPTGEKVIRMRK